MHEKSASIYSLINELSENIVKEKKDRKRIIQKCRTLSFGILLKKTLDYDTDKNFDSFRELNYKLFTEKLASSILQEESPKSTELEKCIDYVSKDIYFTEGIGKDVIHFLFLLQNEENHFIPKSLSSSLLVPGPFTLHAQYTSNQYYPKKTKNVVTFRTNFLKGLVEIKEDNPFASRFGPAAGFLKLRDLNDQSLRQDKICFSSAKKLGYDSFWNENEPRRKVEVQGQTEKQPKIKTNAEVDNQPFSIKNDYLVERKSIFSWNWENLGRLGIFKEYPFVGESNFSLDLQSVYNHSIRIEEPAKVIPAKIFLMDVKSLTAGIQSDSFIFNEFQQFTMLPKLAIEGIPPATVQNYVIDFLECGTCYRRLQAMTLKITSIFHSDGFISKTLRNAIDEYLTTFRELVFSFQDQHLIQFFRRMKRMMRQISNLSYTLAIHPNVEVNIKPPMGSQFLGFLYREIMRLTEIDFITVLVFLLRRCCNVYLKHLEKWIFYGILDDPSDELFICFIDHYRENTKYFYDKAYFVRRESVPGFFQTFEDQILLCGKYAMLLKAFLPNHPLFNLNYPKMSVCLSFEELQIMKDSCQKYFEKAREVCGKPVTIRNIFDKKIERKKKFYEMVSESSRINLKKWQEEQKLIAMTNAEIKKKRHNALTSQLVEIKNRKIMERRANVESELKYLKSIQEQDDRQMHLENINLTKRIEYYQELSELMTEEMDLISKSKSSFGTTSNTISIPEINIFEEDCVVSGNKISTTPGSTTGTEFESCLDDDDSESIYTECISEDFVIKFQETETELKKLFEDGSDNNDDENKIKESSYGGGGMKKSLSDYLNVNELPSDLETNRERNMSGKNVEYCFNNEAATERRLAVNICKFPFSYDIGGEKTHSNLSTTRESNTLSTVNNFDINSNPIEKLMDLQRNRNRMMHSETLITERQDTKIPQPKQRKFLNLDFTSELECNRKKVLNSDFFMFSRSQPTTDDVVGLTPMSTTSDISTHTKEIVNDMDCSLSLNLTTPNESVVIKDMDNLTLLDDTLCIDENSSPYARSRNENDILNGNESLEIVGDHDEACHDDDYQRCVELIESNFKCNTTSPYFRLNFKNTSEYFQSIINKEHIDLNSMSVISLTEFLRKSISIPISTHLEIINNEVMRLFLKNLKILDHFKSLRNYFLLMDGEFGSIICEGIIGKLEKGASPEKLLNYQTLHSILDAAVGSSISATDKNSENLSFIVSDLPSAFDLSQPSVLSNLSLSYQIAWPLTIVLNPESLDQYANIFKYLIKVRRISWVLEESYQMLKRAVKKYGRALLQSPQYRHVQQIRHKFYHFIRSLENHINSNALQASWKTFKDDLLNVQTIEDMYRKHANYIKRIMFLCMLNRRSVEFNKTIESIFTISLRFYRNLKSKEFKLESNDEFFTHSQYEKLIIDELDLDKFIRYTIYLGKKIVRHGYQEEIGEFINLINYNQYYVSDSKK